MALATATLSSRSESSLQHASSPFRSNFPQHGPLSQFTFVDRGLIASLPPALLPSGVIPHFTPLELYKMSTGGMLHSVSTPVMHPNLVSTLKSIISPSTYPSSPDQYSRAAVSEGSSDEGRHSIRRPNERSKRKHQFGLQDMLCSASPSSNQGVYSGGLYDQHAGTTDGDDEAAVVPVDLIRNRRPFKCGYSGCNKTFKNPQTMKMHHKTHYSDDSAYRLGVNANALSTFKAGHNKKIPSRCPICKKTFVGLYELRRHFGRKHSEGEKSFGCRKCGKKFYIEVDLRDHEKLCGEPIECKCGMKFAFKCNLVAHKKGHPECQDHPSTSTSEEEHSIGVPLRQKQQQQSKDQCSRSHNVSGSAVVTSSVPFSSMSTSSLPNNNAAHSCNATSVLPVLQGSVMDFQNMSTQQLSVPHLLSPIWSPLGTTREFPGLLTGFSSDGITLSSSESSYQPVTSTIVTALSRSSPSVLLPNFMA